MGKTVLKKLAKKLKTPFPEPDENELGLTISLNNGAVVVWVSDHPDCTGYMVNTLIHESVHVFQAMMSYIGEKKPGHEIQAYTIAEIAETLLSEYQNQTQGESKSPICETESAIIDVNTICTPPAPSSEKLVVNEQPFEIKLTQPE